MNSAILLKCIRRHTWVGLLIGIGFSAFVAPTHAEPCSSLESFKLLASDGEEGDVFGFSVAISGNTCVIGSWSDGISGSAYIYHFDGLQWIQQAKLVPSDGAEFDQFGRSVAVSGDTVVIGSWLDDDNGNQSGSAYIYRFDGSIWNEEAKIVPSDGDAGDSFGRSVSVSNNTAVVGAYFDDDNGVASGSVYVFNFDGAQWIEEAKLLPSDGAARDNFGNSISVSEDIIAIGSWFDDDNDEDSGSVYIFRFEDAQWVEETKLTGTVAGLSNKENYFGTSLAASENVIIIGESKDDDLGHNSGSAYIYRFNGTQWMLETKLLASDAEIGGSFGQSVSISGDIAMVGSHISGDSGVASGAAYLFHFDGVNWIEETKLLAADGAQEDLFGWAVGVSGDTGLVSSYWDDDLGSNSGSAYIFDLSCSVPCPPDFSGDQVLNFFDVSIFLAAFTAMEPAGDFNGDGVWDFFDVSAFLSAFMNGCP